MYTCTQANGWLGTVICDCVGGKKREPLNSVFFFHHVNFCCNCFKIVLLFQYSPLNNLCQQILIVKIVFGKISTGSVSGG